MSPKKIQTLTVFEQILVCLRLLEKIKCNNSQTFDEMVYGCIVEMEPVFKHKISLNALILSKLKRLLF
ncbi:hypothetical protein ACL6C3_16795 [Capilliphycus salinus ALCB114379]|uniref:hypothetical protein n=1 Tax=Capilliphycus salinus TaxID=2768948 RepID=UPI0039A725FC